LFPLSLHPQVLASTRYGISFSMIFIAYNITILITINNYINIQLGSIWKYDPLTLYISKSTIILLDKTVIADIINVSNLIWTERVLVKIGSPATQLKLSTLSFIFNIIRI